MEYIFLLYCIGYVGSVEENLAGNEHFAFPADNSNKIYEILFFPVTSDRLRIMCSNLMSIASTNYVLIVIFGRRLYRHLNVMAGPHLSQVNPPLRKARIMTEVFRSKLER